MRHALTHETGLPAHLPYHDKVLGESAGNCTGDNDPTDIPANGRARVLELVLKTAPVTAPGQSAVYSDLGFMLLGDRLEKAYNAPLDTLAHQRLFEPLGLSSFRFFRSGQAVTIGNPANPYKTAKIAKNGKNGKLDVAPTEACPVRGRVIQGEVHDLNAWVMGGVAGHAGLFGNARDVARFVRELLGIYAGRGGILEGTLKAEVVRMFWRARPGKTWRLGWDGPSPGGKSLAGRRLDPRTTVGHLGFTGCALWIEPDPGIWSLSLTNRVHPSVAPHPLFRALRPALADATVDILNDPALTQPYYNH